MNPYTEYARKYFSEHPPDCGQEDVRSLLEALCRIYTIYNPINADRIAQQLELLEPDLRSLSRKRVRHIRHIMENMCAEHEQEAFLTGVRVGIQLFAELTEP